MPITRRMFLEISAAVLVTSPAGRRGGKAEETRLDDTPGRRESQVNSAVFRPDGSQVLTTAERDHRAIVWDLDSGRPRHVFAHRWVKFAVFSPDGRAIATGGYRNEDSTGSVILWNAETGEERATLPARGWAQRQPTSRGPTRVLAIGSLGFSADGRRLAAGTTEGTVVLWDAVTGEERHVLREPRTLLQRLGNDFSNVEDLAFHPDGSRLAAALTSGEVQLWDVATGELIARLVGHEWAGLVSSVSWSADGSRLVSASMDETAILWDPASGAKVHTLAGHDGYVWHAAFRPDGARVSTASFDNTARIWDAATGESLHVLEGHEDTVHMAPWSPDGAWLATCSNDATAAVWDGETGKLLHRLEEHRGFVTQVHWSPDGTRLVTASSDATAIVWDARTGRRLMVLGTPPAR